MEIQGRIFKTMTRILIDTDVIIDHLREIDKATQLLLQIKAKRYVGYYSAITEVELLSGRKSNTLEQRRKIHRLLGIMHRVHLDRRVAEEAGKLRRIYQITLPDAIIAASAIVKNAALVTRNVAHYNMIDGLNILDFAIWGF
jgi:predicted nucleic acid-binding protein